LSLRRDLKASSAVIFSIPLIVLVLRVFKFIGAIDVVGLCFAPNILTPTPNPITILPKALA